MPALTISATTKPRPRSLYHPQPQLFTHAGENLTFEIAGGKACSLPRGHLIYAECEGHRLRFRFPLHQVEVSLSAPRMLPVNLPTSESLELLDEILSGAVSVLYAGKPWLDEPPAHAREVQAIDFNPLVDLPRSRS
jgi:hypothetical protein